MTKLAQGLLDLHSKRGTVDLPMLAEFARQAGGSAAVGQRIVASNTAAEAFAHAGTEGIALADEVAKAAQKTAARVVEGRDIAVEVTVFNREGGLIGRAPFAPAHVRSPARKRRR
jgi:cobalt-precorrin-5B (C1)-methyltransferase